MHWANGKTVLVTGGTQGIGQATAALLREAGAIVHITGTRAATSDYDSDLAGMTYHCVDMAQPAERTALAAAFPALDVLINNAGTTRNDEYEIDAFRQVIEVNLNAVMDLTSRLFPLLKAVGGAVVNVGSAASFLSIKETPAYTASKAGLLGLTRVLGDRWARDGVRVNMIAPGFIETRMTAGSRRDADFEKRVLGAVPMRRWGAPREIGEAILFLASPAASYMTGQSLIVDGGLMLR